MRVTAEAGISTGRIVGRVIKCFVQADVEYESRTGSEFLVSANPKLDSLFVRLNMRMGLLKPG